jgi:hypothetical protein
MESWELEDALKALLEEQNRESNQRFYDHQVRQAELEAELQNKLEDWKAYDRECQAEQDHLDRIFEAQVEAMPERYRPQMYAIKRRFEENIDSAFLNRMSGNNGKNKKKKR